MPSPEEPDVRFLMFMIGGSMRGTTNCTSRSGTDEGEELDSSILISTSAYAEGPWSAPFGPVLSRGSAADWDYVVTNPAPVVLENGTVLLYYRGTPKYWVSGARPFDLPESVGLAVAPHWRGPYMKLSSRPILRVMNEDPFVWRDNRGFKMLTHGRDDWWNTHLAFSEDGISWSDGAAVATNTTILLSDGSLREFTNRERPHILFNESTGEPAILFNGVCPGAKYDYAYTLAQYIHQGSNANASSGRPPTSIANLPVRPRRVLV
eukprot:TRINITY_DN70535_c0_g1_i1.p1 TRINITY_DN70535_c0_g1~~TRINITY_DN70535_c0_g1_i1.p1  ORF type:complete len:293 (-),score=30.57 TRINITY_DN70535_c0_g1_i1:59-850(-)